MKVYIVLDLSRVALPVRGVYSCATDAAESAKRYKNAYVAVYNLNQDVES